MASKTIYWIDDNTGKMLDVIHGIISKFWKLDSNEEGIASKIIIFGNASLISGSKALWTASEEREFYDKILSCFKDQCTDIDATNPSKETYNKNKELIKDSVRILYQQECSDVEKDFYRDVLETWGKGELQDSGSEEYKKAQGLGSELITKMQIPPGSGVGIDLELINGDFRDNMVMKRTLSMELYHQLKSINYKCFLYSTEADYDSITKSWDEMYHKLYDTESMSKIKIYTRNDMMKKGNDLAVREIEKMMEQESGEATKEG